MTIVFIVIFIICALLFSLFPVTSKELSSYLSPVIAFGALYIAALTFKRQSKKDKEEKQKQNEKEDEELLSQLIKLVNGTFREYYGHPVNRFGDISLDKMNYKQKILYAKAAKTKALNNDLINGAIDLEEIKKEILSIK